MFRLSTAVIRATLPLAPPAAEELAFGTSVDGEPRRIVSVPASAPVVVERIVLPRGVVTIQDI